MKGGYEHATVHLSCNCAFLITNKVVTYNAVLFSRRPIKLFWDLIHVERRWKMVTVKARTWERTPLKRLERHSILLFSGQFVVVLDYLTLQDKHNIRTLSVNIKLIFTHCETDQKSISKDSLFYHFYKTRPNRFLYFPTMYVSCSFKLWYKSASGAFL